MCNKPEVTQKCLHSLVTRLGSGPIIYPGLHLSIGENIQGPSLIRVPDWVSGRLGNYYLYFADHKGAYIRLAYANDPLGPWHIHPAGSLHIAQSHFLTEPPAVDAKQAATIRSAFAASGIKLAHDVIGEVTAPHIASPDVHVDGENQRIVMYFHGLEGVGHQVSRLATSSDGIHFEVAPETLGRTYLRVFRWQGDTYGLAMPGQFYRAESEAQSGEKSHVLSDFVPGPLLFNKNMRHNAVLVRDDQLMVFWTQVGDVPEHIKVSTLDLTEDWQDWQVSAGVEVLRPETPWEGANAPLEPSMRSTAYGVVNQLRNPAIFVEGENTYLLYAVGGEAGIAIARINFKGH